MYFGITLCFNSFRGALTSKPYAFLARPWEFKSVDSIDVFDALGSNIRVDVRGDKILRILPRSNDSINEDWISDRIRFVCDAIRLQRLDTPLLNLKGNYVPLTWYQALMFFSFAYSLLAKKLSFNSNKLKLANYSYCFNKTVISSPIIDFIGNFLDLESSFVWSKLKSTFLFNTLNADSVGARSMEVLRSGFLLNGTLGEIGSYSSIVLVDFDVKTTAPLLVVRLRNLIKRGVSVYSFGFASKINGITDVGSSGDFFKFLKAQHWLSNRLSCSKVMFIFGSLNFLMGNVPSLLKNLGFNVGYFAKSSSIINALESSMGLSNFSDGQNTNLSPALQVLHTNGSTADVFKECVGFNQNNLKLLSASHGGSLAARANFVLPISTFFEHSKVYLNASGVKQKTHLALTAPNGVLDYSESLLLIYASFFFKVINRTSWRVFFLQLAQASLLAPNNVWLFVNKFFDLFERATPVSCSLLVRSLFLPDCFSELPIQKVESSLLMNSNIWSPRLLSKFVHKNSFNKSFTDLDFYLQDEISLVSSTLVVASRRLNSKETFV